MAAPIRPTAQEHADRVRAAVTALNAAVLEAARDGVGVTYNEEVGLMEGAMAPLLLKVCVWCRL